VACGFPYLSSMTRSRDRDTRSLFAGYMEPLQQEADKAGGENVGPPPGVPAH